ncbi:MAG: GDP-mannose 4,6-dehydratase [Candidatus Aenigmarchaeota archaeon]|nr:GDP-mannose 4,6-dehydratase [Candidatus Aenigmarchaeota archaeon]
MNILITGGAGFIGSNLASKLSEQKHNVTVIDCKLEGSGYNDFNLRDIDVNFIKADMREFNNPKLVKNQDIIFNLSAHLSHTGSMKNPLLDCDINIRASLNLLELCRKSEFKGRVVYTGTRGQYGRPKYLPVDEKHPMTPEDINGLNKQLAENYHIFYHKKFNIDTVCARLTNIYGPKHQMKHGEQGILNFFIRKAMDNETITLFNGAQKRDFLYIDDCINALIKLSQSKYNDVFNVGCGTGISLKRAVEVLNEILPCAVRFELEPEEWKKVEVGNFFMDIKKIRKIGWSPSTNLKTGMEKTIEFYKQNKRYYW